MTTEIWIEWLKFNLKISRQSTILKDSSFPKKPLCSCRIVKSEIECLTVILARALFFEVVHVHTIETKCKSFSVQVQSEFISMFSWINQLEVNQTLNFRKIRNLRKKVRKRLRRRLRKSPEFRIFLPRKSGVFIPNAKHVRKIFGISPIQISIQPEYEQLQTTRPNAPSVEFSWHVAN